MTESKLETMVDGFDRVAKGTLYTAIASGALAATVGSFGAGAYKACTGEHLVGPLAPILTIGAGILSPMIAVTTAIEMPYNEGGYFSNSVAELKDLEKKGKGVSVAAMAGALGLCTSLACYGAGYVVGKLVQ